ncbi:hypothetical protein BC629DRAFT_997176 [Irpex lacteus]|nr:hypothetical protein BC629DRAFT_997176 [Irpex lacteus]
MEDMLAQRQENATDEPSSTTSIEYMLPTCAQAVQLPTELIDMIIHEANNMLWGFKLCSACSLVCRQWRDIALPYLFRDLHLPNGDRGVEECLMFFVSRPTLAGLVEFVDISALHGINLVHLDSLIGCFSNIRGLHISCCTFLHPAELPTSSHHKYTLIQFVWYEDAEVHENDEESPTSWLRPLWNPILIL